MPYAIETQGLTKRFPERKRYRDLILHPLRRRTITALEDVTIQVERGEVFGLLGPNGAGKTTFAKTLCTLVYPTAGSAFVNGHDVTRDPKAVRRTIGYVLAEERSFYWRLTATENLRFFASLCNLPPRDAERKIVEVLELVGLTEAADRPFKGHSSGMRQRLAIARGLLTDPEVLFLDEPTRALDPLAARALRRFFKDVLVGERKRTIVLATHNTAEAEELCDRIAILDRGRVRACDTVSEVKRLVRDKSRHQLRLREPFEASRERLASLALGGCTFEVSEDPLSDELTLAGVELTGDETTISDVIEAVVRLGLKVESCVREEVSLEEVIARVVA